MTHLAELVRRVRNVHNRVRDSLVAHAEATPLELLVGEATVAAGDTVYAIDHVAETELLARFAQDIAPAFPLVLIGEGIEGGKVTLPRGTDESDAAWRVIVDPIDGTRGLMYQKRPAWILTGIAPNKGDATNLADIVAAVQTEIPLVKQNLCDQLWVARGEAVEAIRVNRLTGEYQPIAPQPSQSTELKHGFLSVCQFFPGARDVLAKLEDDIALRLIPDRNDNEPACFTDQYAASAGQLYGLMMGQDRLVVDPRPLVTPLLHKRGEPLSHCCHPYDICTSLIAEEAGVVVTGIDGSPLRAPLDTETDVAWVGYANRELQQLIEPVLGELLGCLMSDV